MRTLPLWVFVVSGLAASAIAARAAHACSPARCFGGYLLPGDGATVPANLPAIVWEPQGQGVQQPELAKITLADADAPAVALAIEVVPRSGSGDYLLVPKAPLVAGKRYVVVDGNACQDVPGPSATFTASAAAPLPTSLGNAVAAASEMAKISVSANAACDASVSASRARVEVALSADAMPWRDVLLYTTWVDGAWWRPQASLTSQPPPWQSWAGYGADVVYRSCSSDDPYFQGMFTRGGLDAGTHQVVFRATIAGAEVALQSAAASATLSCGADDVTPPVDGDDTGDDGGCATTNGAASWWLLGLGALLRRRRR